MRLALALLLIASNAYGQAIAQYKFNPPLTKTGNTVSIPAANGSTNGYLSSTDWTIFNNKGSGNVSSTGTPTNGQLALWTNATTIQGLTALPAANFPALTGEVTTSAGSLATTIANSAVTLAKIQNAVGNSKLLGSGSSGSGNPYTELTATSGGGISVLSSSVIVDQQSTFNPSWSGQHQFGAIRTIASSANQVWSDVQIKNTTTTVTGGTNITNALGFNKVNIQRPVITDSTPITISQSATVYIENSPLVAGSVSITNPYALWVDAGLVRFDGGLGVGVTTDPGAGNVDISGAYTINGAGGSANWNTAYTDRLKWDGGSTGLTAATGRTSLGGTTVGQNLFTLANPSAITWNRVNADNTVTSRTASETRTDLSLVVGTNVQAWDTQLDSLAGLAYTGNSLKVVRVNAGETGFELATVSGGGTPGGSDTNIQFNDVGAFGGVSGFTFDKTNLITNLTGSKTGIMDYQVQNTDAGASSQAVFISKNATYQANYGMTGTGMGAVGDILANNAYLYSDAPNGILLTSNHVTGTIRFAPGGITELARFSPAGGFNVGATSDPGVGVINANVGFKVAGAAASGKYLVGNGINFVSTTGDANPSASVGLSAVNGSATTFLRSDGAPALSQAIAPTWTALHAWKYEDNGTSTFPMVITLGHNTTDVGGGGAGFGAGIDFQAEDTTTADQSMGQIVLGWDSPTHASHRANASVLLSTGGAAPTRMAYFSGAGGLSIGQTTSVVAANGVINAATGYRVANANATSGKIMQGEGTNMIYSTATWPTTATAQTIVGGDGTNFTATDRGAWDGIAKVAGSDFTTTSATLVDITGLVTTTLTNATLYEYEAQLYVNSTTTAGVIVGIADAGTGSGNTITWTGTATNAAATAIAIGSNSATASAACVLVNGDGEVTIKGHSKTLSTGTATIKVDIGKVTSGTAKVYIGSVLKWRKA